ncbi:3-hydroxyacyl-CoA dehydrogenase family protein [Ruegeria hyattellae]|uniref:3-hydroxyacyl-CoA dehydrogenase family protein n=1 Tax=Ruegeria hyattellae TaxID=3233337 RepID=UPI00355B01DC
MTQVVNLAIVGAGTMGTGIALNAAHHGINVNLVDISQAALQRSNDRLKRMLARRQTKGIVNAIEAKQCLSRITLSTDMSTLRSAEIVIEAVFEDFAVKSALLPEISAHCTPSAVIATNTSALQVSDLARTVISPERFLGMHFFSPADTSPVVELIKGAQSDNRSLRRAETFLRQTHRDVLQCKDTPGFAINRFFVPFLNAAALAVDRGYGSFEQINDLGRALVGSAIGPFEVMNFIKPEIALNAMINLSVLGPDYQPANSLRRLAEDKGLWELETEAKFSPNLDQALQTLLHGIVLPVSEIHAAQIVDRAELDRCAKIALQWSRGPNELVADFATEKAGSEPTHTSAHL